MNELNKKIAELKGLCWHEYGNAIFINHIPFRRESALFERQPCEKCGDTELSNKDWQHNIADAWELFEELPDFSNIKKREARDYKYEVIIDGTHYDGKTAPEAICKAYIAWKEGK